METTEKITLDMLRQDSVSILKQQFDEDGNQVGLNVRCAYMNTAQSREKLKQELPPDKWDELIAVWGDEPTIEEPKIPEPVIDFEKIVANKQSDIKKWCNEKIVSGISIDLGLADELGTPLGKLHYTLSDRNQEDMRDIADMIKAGANEVTWRDDSRVSHMVYTSQQFMVLYQAATEFILRCRFHSDGLEELLFTYSKDEIEKVQLLSWDTQIPKDIQNRMDYLLDIMLHKGKVSEDEQTNE